MEEFIDMWNISYIHRCYTAGIYARQHEKESVAFRFFFVSSPIIIISDVVLIIIGGFTMVYSV